MASSSSLAPSGRVRVSTSSGSCRGGVARSGSGAVGRCGTRTEAAASWRWVAGTRPAADFVERSRAPAAAEGEEEGAPRQAAGGDGARRRRAPGRAGRAPTPLWRRPGPADPPTVRPSRLEPRPWARFFWRGRSPSRWASPRLPRRLPRPGAAPASGSMWTSRRESPARTGVRCHARCRPPPDVARKWRAARHPRPPRTRPARPQSSAS